ncbi:hypothetical protein A6R68_13171 [Neotoma lepida]|uniref:Uncharacterized protein n=1 Tax=Neotoma lepida TaxID=56216 RepID=A0A1A6H3S9_NEOLE|nr:hypothetical protein A6R68_13171 [Neotoma lepida]
MLQTFVMLVLGMHYQCALGFPVYDFDPSSLQEALKASVAKVNEQSLSPYLFQETRSSLKRLNGAQRKVGTEMLSKQLMFMPKMRKK